MSLILSEKPKLERKLPEAGAQPAYITQIVGLGTQETEFQGERKKVKKLRLVAELCNETIEKEEQINGGPVKKLEVPMVIGQDYTASIGPKSRLRALLEGIEGRALTGKELAELDLKKYLGRSCLLNIQIATSGAGRQYCKITGAAKIPKGFAKLPERVNDLVSYDVDEKEGGAFPTFPQWLKDRILASDELGNRKTISGNNEDGMPF